MQIVPFDGPKSDIPALAKDPPRQNQNPANGFSAHYRATENPGQDKVDKKADTDGGASPDPDEPDGETVGPQAAKPDGEAAPKIPPSEIHPESVVREPGPAETAADNQTGQRQSTPGGLSVLAAVQPARLAAGLAEIPPDAPAARDGVAGSRPGLTAETPPQTQIAGRVQALPASLPITATAPGQAANATPAAAASVVTRDDAVMPGQAANSDASARTAMPLAMSLVTRDFGAANTANAAARAVQPDSTTVPGQVPPPPATTPQQAMQGPNTDSGRLSADPIPPESPPLRPDQAASGQRGKASPAEVFGDRAGPSASGQPLDRIGPPAFSGQVATVPPVQISDKQLGLAEIGQISYGDEFVFADKPIGGDLAPVQFTSVRGINAAPVYLKAEMGGFPAANTAEVLTRQIGRAAEISLQPKELGRVRMVLSPTEQGLSLVVTLERPETLDVMRRHADQLAQEFRKLGYEDVGFEFRQEGGQQRGHHAPQPTAEDPGGPTGQPLEDPVQATSKTGLDVRV